MLGWNFQLALEVLEALEAAKLERPSGFTQGQLATQLRVDVLQLQRPLQVLTALEWVGRLEPDTHDHQHYVLLVDLARQPARVLVDQLLWMPVAGDVLRRERLFAKDTSVRDLFASR